jgi:hypothetical protein
MSRPGYRQSKSKVWTVDDELNLVRNIGTGELSNANLRHSRKWLLRMYIKTSYLRPNETFIEAGRELARILLKKEDGNLSY